MTIMEEILEIRSRIEILVNDMKIYTTDLTVNKELQRYTYWGIIIF